MWNRHFFPLRTHRTSYSGTVRRESCLSYLPHHFTSALKAQLHRSDVDSDLLFDVDSIDKAIGQALQVVSVSFIEAAAKALIKQKPKQETPLVEKHPRPSISADSRSQSGPSHQRFTTLTLAILLKLVVLLQDSLRPRHFESDSPSPSLMIGGYLAQHLATWDDMGPETWVLQVHNGYRTPFQSFQPLSRFPQHLAFYSTDSE